MKIEVKAMKIEELSSICNDLITNGVGVDIDKYSNI